MPKYVDHHFNVPRTRSDRMLEDLRSDNPDDFGVQYLNIVVTAEGHQFCFADSANVNAIVSSHKSHGLPLQPADIHQIWIGSLPSSL